MEWMIHSIKTLFRQKLRSCLTILGIAIGVFSVTIISVIGEVGKGAINQQLSNMGIDGVVLTTETSSHKRFGDSALQILAEDEAVIDSMPFDMQYAEAYVHGLVSKCLVFGVEPDADRVISLELLHGRFITEREVRAADRVCVVDQSYAMQTYHRSNIVGKTIEINLNDTRESFEVVGVVSAGGNMLQGLMGEYIPSFIYLPLTVMQQGNREEYNKLLVQLQDAGNTKTVERVVEAVQQEVGDTVNAQNLVQQKEKFGELMDMVTAILAVIAAISLLVSGISIMTVMLTSVTERTQEIGIKKAIGATSGRILGEFLTESFLICLFGSIMGLSIGIICADLGCRLLGLSLVLSWKTMLASVGVSLLIGVVFGVYPAQKAAKLKPIDALRSW